MLRCFQNHWKNLGAVHLMAALLLLIFTLSCSDGVKQVPPLGWKVDVLAGSQQVSLPKRPFPNPVEVTVKDPNGQPVIEGVIEFRLVEESLLGGTENVSTEKIVEAWKNEAAALTSSNAAIRTAAIAAKKNTISGAAAPEVDIEERVGRIDQFDTRTNKEGKAKVWVIAPALFNKKIAVLAQAGPEDNASYSFALLSTSDLKEGSRLVLETANRNKEKVGTEFDMTITIVDTEGRVASTFEGFRKLKIEASPSTSWAGFTPEFPNGEIDCQFSGGRCLVPRGPFRLRVPEKVKYRLSFSDNLVNPIEGDIEATADGERAFIAVKNFQGPPPADSKPITSITLPAGANAQYTGAWIDANGNYLEEVAEATWNIDSDRLLSGLTPKLNNVSDGPAFGNLINFSPSKSGTGLLSVSAENKGLIAPIVVTVPAADQTKWAFRINGQDVGIAPIKAGTCVDVDIFASDNFGNINPNIKGEHTLTLTMESTDTAPVLAKSAHWGDVVNLTQTIVDRKINFSEGLARSVEKACFYDATRPAGATEKPTIKVVGKSELNQVEFQGALELDIAKNQPNRLMVMDANDPSNVGNDSKNVCTRDTREEFGDPCLVFKFGLATDKLRLGLVDVAGNWLRDVKVEWTDTPDGLSGTPNLTLTPGVSATDFSPVLVNKPGTGKITAKAVSTDLSPEEKTAMGFTATENNIFIKYNYVAVSGDPSSLTVEVPSTITAGVDFPVSAVVRDASGARVETQLDTKTTLSNETYRVAKAFTTTPSDSAVSILSNGCHTKNATGDSFNAATFKDDFNTPGKITSGLLEFPGQTLKINRATQGVGDQTPCVMQIKVESTFAGFPTKVVQALIQINPSTVNSIKLRGAANGELGDSNDGADLSVSGTCDGKPEIDGCHVAITKGKSKKLFVAGYDEFKNYAGNVLATFTWTNVAPVIGSIQQYEIEDTIQNLSAAGNSVIDIEVSPEKQGADDTDGPELDSGGGFVTATLKDNTSVTVKSTFFDFVSEVARKFEVDFISPDSENPTVFWSSSDGGPTNPQLLAGMEFAVRLRAVDEFGTPIETYNGRKQIRFVHPALTTWGKPTELPLFEANNISKNKETEFICVFRRVEGAEMRDPTNSSDSKPRYTTTFIDGENLAGSECILRNVNQTAPNEVASKPDGVDEDTRTDARFSMLDTTRAHDFFMFDLTPNSTIDGVVIASAKPLPNTGSDELVLASDCGGVANGDAVAWFLRQKRTAAATEFEQVPFDKTLEAFKLTADESVNLFPAITDSFGNYKGEALSATLTVKNSLTNTEIAGANGNTITSQSLSGTVGTGCSVAHKKFTFAANKATDQESNKTVLVSAAQGTLKQEFKLVVSPGTPSKLRVRLANAIPISDTTSAPVERSANDVIPAGTCLSPIVTVRDTDNNLVHTFSKAVNADFWLTDYYTDALQAGRKKQLIQPGGLYRQNSDGQFIPQTQLDTSHVQSPVTDAANSFFNSTTAMDSKSIKYFGSERSTRIVNGGVLDLRDRFVCLMDSGRSPKFFASIVPAGEPQLDGDTTVEQPLTIGTNTAAAVDYRNVDDEQVCRQPFAVTGFQVYTNILDVEAFKVITGAVPTCRSLQVSSTANAIRGFWTDKVGNFIDSTPAPVGKWISVSAPAGTNILGQGINTCFGGGTPCDETKANLTLENLHQKGNLTATWSPPVSGIPTGFTPVNTFLTLPVKAGLAADFSVALNRNTSPKTDDAFGIIVKLLDEFGNETEPESLPKDGTGYHPTAAFTYLNDAALGAPNGSTTNQLKPTSVTLDFVTATSTTTANIFRLLRATGNATIRTTFAPRGDFVGAGAATTVQRDLTFTVLAGAPVTNQIFFSDISGANKDRAFSTDSDNIFTTTNDFQQVEVRSLDAAGNSTDSPQSVFSYASGFTLLPPQQHPSLPFAGLLPLLQAGTGTLRATLTSNGATTVDYPVRIVAASPTKLRLVRVQSDGTAMPGTGDDPNLTTSTNPPLLPNQSAFFKIQAVDAQNNVAETIAQDGVELSWDFGDYPVRSEGGRAQLPGCPDANCPTPFSQPNTCKMVGGVCKDPASAATDKIYEVRYFGATGATTGKIEVRANLTIGASTSEFAGTFGLKVNPAAFHHYGVIPNRTSVEARADKSGSGGNFSVRVEARDQFGNKVAPPNVSDVIGIKIVREDGTSAPSGVLTGGTTGVFGATNTFINYPNLFYDEPGQFRVVAFGPSDAGMSTIAAAPLINFEAGLFSVADFRLAIPAGVTDVFAGSETTLRFEAVDNYGNPVRGIDNILRNDDYTWAGIGSLTGADGTARQPTQISGQTNTTVKFNSATHGTFIDGVALVKVTFFEARNNYRDTLSINNATQSKAVTIHPAAGNTLRVLPATLNKYRLLATDNSQTGLTSLANNSNRNARSSDGLFRIVVQPLDAFGNLRAGDTGVSLTAEAVDNTLTTTQAVSSTDATFNAAALNLEPADPAINTAFKAGVGFEFKDLFYRVGQKVKWKVTGVPAGVSVEPSVDVVYLPQIETVASYRLKLDNNDANTWPNTTAGTAISLKLEPLDVAGNLVTTGTTLDSALQAQSYTISGVQGSGASAPTLTTTFAFTNGIGVQNGIVLRKSQRFEVGELLVTDNNSGLRKGANAAGYDVVPAAVSTLTPDNIPAQVAGVVTTLRVVATDAFGNLSANGCATPPVVKATDGSNLASPGGHNGSVTNAISNASAGDPLNTTASIGVFQKAMTFFQASENSIFFEGCGVQSAAVVVSVIENFKANEVQLSNSSVEPSTSLTTPQECMPVDGLNANIACPTIFAFMWDEYGNRWRRNSGNCDWTAAQKIPSGETAAIAASGTPAGVPVTDTTATVTNASFINRDLTCTLAGTNTTSGNAIVRTVELFGGIGDLGSFDGTTVTTNPITNPATRNAITAGSTLTITNLALLQWRGGQLQAVNRQRSEEYTLNASGLGTNYQGGSNPLPTNLTVNHAANGVNSSAIDLDMTFPTTPATDTSFTITTRNVSKVIGGIRVSTGVATDIVVGNFNTQSPTAGGDVILSSVDVFDNAGNRAACTTLTITAAASTLPPACNNEACDSVNPNIPFNGIPANFTTRALNANNSRLFTAASPGQFTNLTFQLYKATQAVTLTVDACGLSRNFVFSVLPEATSHVRLAASNTAPSATATAPLVNCPLGNRLDVNCPTVNAFFWDQFGNVNPAGTCTSWSFDKASGSTSKTDGDGFTLAATGTSQSIKTPDTIGSFLSGRLACVSTGGSKGIALMSGGLTSLTATHTFGGTAAATSKTAAANNLTVNDIQARMKKVALSDTSNIDSSLVESEVNKDDIGGLGAQNLVLGSTSGSSGASLTDATLPMVASTTVSCTFNASGACALNANLSLRRAETNRVITVSYRDVTAALPALTVTPAGAHQISPFLWRTIDTDRITVANPMLASDNVGANIRVVDEFGNPTDFINGSNSTACTAAADDITVVGGTLDNTNSTLTTADRLFQNTALGHWVIESTPGTSTGLNVRKAGDHTLRYKMCGLTADLTIRVQPAVLNEIRLHTSAAAPAASLTSLNCPLNATGTGATCQFVNAFFFDAHGNQRIGDTCDHWQFDLRDAPAYNASIPAGTYTVPTPFTAENTNAEANTASVRVNHSNFIDGTLKCTRGAFNRTLPMHGGIAFMNVSHTTGNLTALNGNFSITSVQLHGPAGDNTAVILPQVLTNETIELSSNATRANDPDANAVIPSAAVTCNFSQNSKAECTTAMSASFTKVETARNLTVKVRGLTYTTPNFNVVANNADSITARVYTGADPTTEANQRSVATPLVAGESFRATVNAVDQFSNDTSGNCNAAAMTITSSVNLNDPLGGASQLTGGGVAFAADAGFTGRFSVNNNMNIKKATTTTLTFTACGRTTTRDIKIVPAAHSYTRVSTAEAAPAANTAAATLKQRCPLAASGAGVTCEPLNAFMYDVFGNLREGDTCTTWTYAATTGTTHSGTLFESDGNKVTRSSTGGARTTRITSTDWMDGTVTCANGAITHSIQFFGGITKLDVTHTSTAAVTAGSAFALNSVQLTGPTYTADVFSMAALPDNLNAEPVSLQTTAVKASAGNPAEVVKPAWTCNFVAGVCDGDPAPSIADALNLNFSKAQDGITFSVFVRGKVFSPAVFNVAPTTASRIAARVWTTANTDANLKNETTPLSAGDAFGATINAFDQFDNRTAVGCVATQAGMTIASSANLNAPVDSAASTLIDADHIFAAKAGTIGEFEVEDLLIRKATTTDLTFTACGRTTVYKLRIVPKAERAFARVTTGNAAPSGNTSNDILRERCALAGSGSGVVCNTLNAFIYDSFGNVRDGQNCTSWTYTKTGGTTPTSNEAAATLTNTGTTSSTRLTSSDWIDGRVKCVVDNDDDKSHSIHFFGGIESLAMAHSSTTNVVAGAAFSLTSLTLKGPSYDNSGVLTFPAIEEDLNQESVTLQTTAQKAVTGNPNEVVNPAWTCNFVDGVCTSGTSPNPTTALSLHFTRKETGVSFTAFVRGKSINSGNFNVNPANASATTTTFKLVNVAGDAIIDSNPSINQTNADRQADQTFNLHIDLLDQFGNKTDKRADNGNTCATTNSSTIAQTTVLANGNNDNATKFTGPALNSFDATALVYKLTDMKLTGPGANTLTINTCGVSHLLNLNISAGAAHKFFLNKSTTASKTNVDEDKCSLLSGGGTSCDTIRAWFFDQFGNHRAGDTCDSWALTNLAVSSPALTVPALDNQPSPSISVSANSALDARLTCVKAGGATEEGTVGVVLFGGVQSVDATLPASGNITAGTSNFAVSGLQLKGRKNNTVINAEYAGTLPISFSTTASAGLDGTLFTSTPATDCNFSATGACATTFNFSFVRADATARALTINVHGVSNITGANANVRNNIIVAEGNPTKVISRTVPDTVAADATISGTFNLTDAFDNPSCSEDLTISATQLTDLFDNHKSAIGTAPTIHGTTLTAANKGTAISVADTSKGTYALNSTALRNANSTGLTLTFAAPAACGNFSFTHTIKTTNGVFSDFKFLNSNIVDDATVQSTTQPAKINCKHTAESGSGVTCDSIYAYFRDNQGNLLNNVQNNSCKWIYTPIGTSNGPAAASLPLGRSITLTHSKFLDGNLQCQRTVNGVAQTGASNLSTAIPVQGGISRVALELRGTSTTAINGILSAASNPVVAGNDNVGIRKISLFTRQNNTEVDVSTDATIRDDYDFATEPIEFVTTAQKAMFGTPNNVVPNTPSCTFADGKCDNSAVSLLSGIAANQKLSLTRSGASGSNDVAVRIRGITSNTLSMIVNSANAASLVVTAPTSLQNAGSELKTLVSVRGFDTFGNDSLRSCTGFTAGALPTSPAGDTSVFTFGSFDAATNVTIPIDSLIIKAAGNHSIPVTANGCGLSVQIPLTVQSNTTLGRIVISSETTAPNFSAANGEVACATLNGGNDGVSCPDLFSYHYDAFGNKLASAASTHTCDWKVGGTLEGANAGVQTRTRASDSTTPHINELISCQKTVGSDTFTSNSIRLFGGPHTLSIASAPATTTLVAGFGNFQISKLTLQSQKDTSLVPMPGLNATAQTVTFSTSGQPNLVCADPDLPTNSCIHTGSVSCTFSTSGECSPNALFNFKKVHNTDRTLTASVRGKSASVTITSVSAGPAAKLVIGGLTGGTVDALYPTATSSIATTITAKDEFDNGTTTPKSGGNCSTVNVTGNDQGAYADNIAITNTNSNPSNAALKIYKAGTHNLTFSKCGVSVTEDLTITAGAVRRTLLTTDDVQPSVFNCVSAGDNIQTTRECSFTRTCAANAAGTAAGTGCGALFAWHYDKAGNFIAAGTNTKSCGAGGASATFTNVDTGVTVAAATTGSSGSAVFAASGNGFAVTAPANKYLRGDVSCKPDSASHLGGSVVQITAPVTLTAPTVECTPWMYTSTRAAESLCQFKNETGVTLSSAEAFTPAQTLDSTEAHPELIHKPSMTADILNNNFAQFIVEGVAGKMTSKFKLRFTSSNNKVLVADSPVLRVPLRKSDSITAPVTTAPQETAADAGANLTKAEQAEDTTVPTVATDRRIFYYTHGGFTWADCATGKCETAKASVETLDTTFTTFPLLADPSVPANDTFIKPRRYNAHPMQNAFFFVTTTSTNTDRCMNKTNVSDNSSCKIDVEIDHTKGKNLRGVWWLKDSAGNPYYFMTPDDPD
ncbi:MAG: hypothetical protein RLZZ488_689 [Pseudomonadota bacterium]|jgi:hypothetical protein